MFTQINKKQNKKWLLGVIEINTCAIAFLVYERAGQKSVSLGSKIHLN